MPEIKDITQEITKTARDAAYVAVGLGVLSFQRAQVRRQALAKRFTETPVADKLTDLRGEFTKVVKDVDSKVEEAINLIESSVVEPVEDLLPEQARDFSKQLRGQVSEARQQIRHKILSAA
jgi:hypothetical protein